MRDKFLVDLRSFGTFSGDFKEVMLTIGTDALNPASLCERALTAINRGRVSKLEAYISLICWRQHAKNKGKAVVKAEDEFAVSKLLASEHVHPILWKKACEAKASSKADAAAPRK
jgi:hypothetical protein